MGRLHACVRVFSGETVEREAITEVVQDAKELVNAFSRSSKRVPRAVAVLDDILNKLRPQVSLSAFEDLMGFCVCCIVVVSVCVTYIVREVFLKSDNELNITHFLIKHSNLSFFVWNVFFVLFLSQILLRGENLPPATLSWMTMTITETLTRKCGPSLRGSGLTCVN